MTEERQKYIGDGIHVGIADNGSIVIWDDNGPEKVNQVVLEPEVFTRLVERVTQCRHRTATSN